MSPKSSIRRVSVSATPPTQQPTPQKAPVQHQQSVDPINTPHTNLGAITDKQTLRAFFAGEHCVFGGSGWWRYEYCYGRHVTQYHQDAMGRTTLYLGKWDEKAHRVWILANPLYKPKDAPHRQLVSLYYGSGDYCQAAKKKRQVVVKIKCQTTTNKPHAISMYLVEPRTCDYELVVESKLFCAVLSQADSDGIILNPKL